jgi:transcriptional regulator with XRE-family HTH domain
VTLLDKLMGLGEKLRFFRERKKLYQQDVANTLNVTQQTISHYEKGRIVPDLETLIKLAELYEVTLNELYPIDSHVGLTEGFNNLPDPSNKNQFLRGERIKKRRIERHLSQEDLAKLMNQSVDTIANWETSDFPTGKITYNSATRLAMILQSPLAWLMGMADSPWFVPPMPEEAYFGHSLAETNDKVETGNLSKEEAEYLRIVCRNISELSPEQRKKRIELVKIAMKMVEEIEHLDRQDSNSNK